MKMIRLETISLSLSSPSFILLFIPLLIEWRLANAWYSQELSWDSSPKGPYGICHRALSTHLTIFCREVRPIASNNV